MVIVRTYFLILISIVFVSGCDYSSDSDPVLQGRVYAKSDISAFSACSVDDPCGGANQVCVNTEPGTNLCVDENRINEIFACTTGELLILETFPVQLRCSSTQ